MDTGELTMKKRMSLLTALLLIASLIITACGSNGTPSSGNGDTDTGNDPIVVGGVLELTGNVSSFGQSTRDGVLLAFEEINAAGGVLGRQIKFIPEDNKSQQAESATAAQKLIQQDKVVAILGAVASSNTLAAAPIAQQAKIPLISPSSTNPAVTQVGDYIFRACFIDPFQGNVMASFAVDNLSATTAAIMTDNNSDYSIGLAEVFRAEFEAKGGKIVSEVSFSSGDTDFNTILTTIKNANPEVVFIPAYYDSVGLILDQAKNNVGFSEDIKFLGTDGWDSPTLFELAGDSANGTFFSNHYSPETDSPEVKNFVSKYQAKYNAVPDALAALAYDAAYMLADAIERAGSTDSAALRDALVSTDLAGVGGQLKLNENRDPIKSAVVIKVEDQEQTYYTTVNP